MKGALRVALILLSVMATLSAFGRNESTQFRKHHTLLIEAEPGRTITVELTAIRASTGYPDALAYRIFGPDGKTAASGRLEPGQSDTLELTPRTAGVYLLDADPGMNAFIARVEGAPWAVDIGRSRQVNVISQAAPLYFFVPEGLKQLTLRFSGEAATVRLFAPDNNEVASRMLANYESADVAVPVEAGQAGWWRLDLDLAEDQAVIFPMDIPPVVATEPLSEETMRVLVEEPPVVDFDLRPTPREQLATAEDEAETHLRTDDGLALGFDSRARLVSVAVDGQELMDDGSPVTGFLVRDVAGDSDLVAFEGSVTPTGGGVRAASEAPGMGLALDALYAQQRNHISVDVTVRNLREGDRAVTIYFALPFPTGDVTWWGDIHTPQPTTGNVTLGNFASISAGANGRHSQLPFGCVTGDQGLALSIPMDHPILHRIGASTAGHELFLAVDLGLTEATTKFPNAAHYSFIISRCDPAWGLRSAVERYYRTFPEMFTRRIPEDGGWVCWGDCANRPNAHDLGFLYHWGPGGPAAVKYDDEHGLYSFLYNDSARYFADLGKFDERPSAAQAAEAMSRLLDAEDPRAVVLSAREGATGRARYLSTEARMGREAAEQWLRESIEAVKRSAALDADGNIEVGYLVNREDWGGTDWWTGRAFCNIDPDIPGGYGQFLFDHILAPQVEMYHEEGAEPDGFGLDNFFSNANNIDFDRAHLAACDFPPTFAAGDYRPVVTGAECVYEWTAELKRRLEAEGKWLMANTGRQPFCFAQNLLDMNGLEWGMEAWAPAARVLAYHKPVVTLPVRPEHYEEPFIRAHLRMGAIPGGYATGDRFQQGSEVARLYERYVPLLLRMSAAGWEPIPYATADQADVRIERFGSELPLLLSVHNASEEPVEARVTVDLSPLGLQTPAAVREMPGGEELDCSVDGDALSFTLTLAAGDVTAVEIR